MTDAMRRLGTTWLKYMVLVEISLSCWVSGGSDEAYCRDRSGYYDPLSYKLTTCATCYGYLFPLGKELGAYRTWLVAYNGSLYEDYTMFPADVANSTYLSSVCATLNADECARWVDCCKAAERCCEEQQETPTADAEGGMCPRTWDGYSCWKDTPRKTLVTVACPAFIPHAIPSVKATKRCDTNGSWFRDPVTDLEWTNYTACLNMDHIKTGIFISVGCNLTSLILLIPSVIIFLAFRSLRQQHRIRLHINLFLSFIFSSFIFILWDILVYYDRLVTTTTESRMHGNSAGCKFLYVLTRYSRSTNFMWMFLEGFYLHRLIVNAFEPPRSLLPLYILGWGVPWIPVALYSILHAIYDDLSCWVNPFGAFEWIIYIPNLAFLAMNLGFLVNILRILLTQISVHPNEPSNYSRVLMVFMVFWVLYVPIFDLLFRRALKATSVLVPLFGIQLMFIIYRPPSTSAGAKEFEIVSYLITNLQGFFVALIFCFLNSEVVTLLRMTADRLHIYQYRRRQPKPSITLSTQVPWGEGRRSFLSSPDSRQHRRSTYSRGESLLEESTSAVNHGSWRYTGENNSPTSGKHYLNGETLNYKAVDMGTTSSGRGDTYIPMISVSDE